MNENKKSYYAIIPANVRYDEKLTPNAKLLYGEITALCNEKGYCWATNNYFAELYKVSIKSISRWINQLKKFNYIKIDIIYKENSKEIVHRYIQIWGEGIDNFRTTPMDKKVKDNTTLINNTVNNKNNNKSSSFNSILKDKYNTFLLNNGYTKEDIKQYIFGSPIELKQLSNLYKKFDNYEKFDFFINQIKTNNWLKSQGFVPSKLIGQVSSIMINYGKQTKQAYKKLVYKDIDYSKEFGEGYDRK